MVAATSRAPPVTTASFHVHRRPDQIFDTPHRSQQPQPNSTKWRNSPSHATCPLQNGSVGVEVWSSSGDCPFTHHEMQSDPDMTHHMCTRGQSFRRLLRTEQNVFPFHQRTRQGHTIPSNVSARAAAGQLSCPELCKHPSFLGGTMRHVALTREAGIDAPCDNLLRAKTGS